MHYIGKVINTELQGINRLIDYRDAHKDTWIGFRENIAKHAIECYTFMASRVLGYP